MPALDDEAGIIDVTNVVENMRSTFVTWAVSYLVTEASVIPYLGVVVNMPILRWIFKDGLTFFLNLLTKSEVMLAFFLNTAVRKASQAEDYTKAVAYKISLPPSATDADYAEAEQDEIAAFNSFVVLGN